MEFFKELYTPNDAFYVRYHLAGVPQVECTGLAPARRWRQLAERPREFTLSELRRDFEQVEIAAVNQCSGNRRGLFEPHVAGIQWGYGGMGNARWRGVRLRDVLAKTGVRKEAVEVVLDGADTGVMAATPDFVKSLPVWQGARREHADRLRDERRAVAALERLPGAARRARLDGHLLGEAADRDQRGRHALRRLLDEDGLPRARGARSAPMHSPARRPRSTRRSPA